MFESARFGLSLASDNHSGVHPRVLEAMLAANRGHAHAYGLDEVSELTRAEFKRVFGADAEPYYVFTGTAANVLSLSPFMRSFEAVIASEVAHLHLDECAAPEKFLGGKVWTLPTRDGKIRPAQADTLLERRGDQHFAQPRVVSLTQPTELGTTYSLEELRAWRTWCSEKNLMLHLDGARLANAAAFLNVSLREMMTAAQPDVVSLGGTKSGLLGAEAVVVFDRQAREPLRFLRKQAMQLPSKSRYLAAQFYAYLTGDLFVEIAKHTTASARRLADRLSEFPEIRLAHPVESNALFVSLPAAWMKPLRERFFFYVWDADQEARLCRWMISWDWTDATEAAVLAHIREVKQCFPIA